MVFLEDILKKALEKIEIYLGGDDSKIFSAYDIKYFEYALNELKKRGNLEFIGQEKKTINKKTQKVNLYRVKRGKNDSYKNSLLNINKTIEKEGEAYG